MPETCPALLPAFKEACDVCVFSMFAIVSGIVYAEKMSKNLSIYVSVLTVCCCCSVFREPDSYSDREYLDIVISGAAY